MTDSRATAPRIHGVTWLVFRDDLITGEPKILLERCEKKARVLGVGEWFVPGGKIEGDETPECACRREIAEEWGVDVDTMRPLPIVEGSHVPPGPKGVFLMRPFLVTLDADEVPSSSSEGTPLRWTPIAEALASPVLQVRMMVAAAMDAAPAPQVAALVADQRALALALGCDPDTVKPDEVTLAACALYRDMQQEAAARFKMAEQVAALTEERDRLKAWNEQLGALSMQHQLRETQYEDRVASLSAALEAAKAELAEIPAIYRPIRA